jgi:hypothetical protein
MSRIVIVNGRYMWIGFKWLSIRSVSGVIWTPHGPSNVIKVEEPHRLRLPLTEVHEVS